MKNQPLKYNELSIYHLFSKKRKPLKLIEHKTNLHLIQRTI